MFKFLQNNFSKLILPICFIIGLIRRQQIEAYQASIRKPTMTGAFTFFFYLFAGTCLTIITLLLDGIYRSKLSKTKKNILYVIVLVIGLPLVIFILLLFH